jgi:2-iminobutanoate/2-iminopropanoate deaminase
MMQFIKTHEAPQALGPYSQAVSVNGLIYTSGQIGFTADGVMAGDDIESQIHQVMKNLSAVLAGAKAQLSDVIKTTIFLADMNDFDKVNTVYAQYFGEHKPVRSTVAVKTLPKNALVEIECIAVDAIVR